MLDGGTGKNSNGGDLQNAKSPGGLPLVSRERREGTVTFGPHEGSLDLQHARPLGGTATPR